MQPVPEAELQPQITQRERDSLRAWPKGVWSIVLKQWAGRGKSVTGLKLQSSY